MRCILLLKGSPRSCLGNEHSKITEDLGLRFIPVAELEEEQINLDTNYETLWNYLSGTDSLVVRGQKTLGLGLSAELLNKIYYKNTANFLKLE